MKTTMMLCAMVLILVACGKKETATVSETVPLPMEFFYKGAFTIGDIKNVQTVLECNKRLSMLNADIGEFIADTLSWHMVDGTEITAPRDSAVAFISQFIGSLSSMKLDVTTAIPVDNAFQNHQWVLFWSDETYNYKDGKVEHQLLQEGYRMQNGKIRELYQYAKKLPGSN